MPPKSKAPSSLSSSSSSSSKPLPEKLTIFDILYKSHLQIKDCRNLSQLANILNYPLNDKNHKDFLKYIINQITDLVNPEAIKSIKAIEDKKDLLSIADKESKPKTAKTTTVLNSIKTPSGQIAIPEYFSKCDYQVLGITIIDIINKITDVYEDKKELLDAFDKHKVLFSLKDLLLEGGLSSKRREDLLTMFVKLTKNAANINHIETLKSLLVNQETRQLNSFLLQYLEFFFLVIR
jgi:hypothetical protein